QYMGPASAYYAVLAQIDTDIGRLIKTNPAYFTFEKPGDGTVNTRDSQTTGVVAFAKGCTISRLHLRRDRTRLAPTLRHAEKGPPAGPSDAQCGAISPPRTTNGSHKLQQAHLRSNDFLLFRHIGCPSQDAGAEPLRNPDRSAPRPGFDSPRD